MYQLNEYRKEGLKKLYDSVHLSFLIGRQRMILHEEAQDMKQSADDTLYTTGAICEHEQGNMLIEAKLARLILHHSISSNNIIHVGTQR